jgi:signal transduction histidine kinase
MDDDPARARALLRKAREGTSTSLAELRDLVRGVNPPVRVERRVVEAIRALALDSPANVHVDAPDRIRTSALTARELGVLSEVGSCALSTRLDL